MEYRITDFLDCLEEAGQDLKPHGGNTVRVRKQTLAKLHEAAGLPASRRRTRSLTGLVAAAAAVLLLCGSVFAAWKLGVFHFKDTLGPEGAVLDNWAVTFDTTETEIVAADQGYANWTKAQVGDYNLVLLELTAYEGQLHAVADVSPKDESCPPFRDSGLRLYFAGYETEQQLRQMDRWTDRITLSAPLPEPLPDGTGLCLVLTGLGQRAETPKFRVGYSRFEAPEAPTEPEPKFVTSAQTTDYCFTLRTLAVSESVIYAVMDVEARTAFGLEHLDECPEFAVTNRSNPGSGMMLDARLIACEDGVRRYLMGYLKNYGDHAVGDVISFELLALREAGDMAAHPYSLFDVQVEQLVPGAVTVVATEEPPETGTVWMRLKLDSLGLRLEGHVDWKTLQKPQVVLVFRDGRCETVLDNDWRPTQDALPPDHTALQVDMGGWRDGTDYLGLVFSRPIDIETLCAVEVDGQEFIIEP